MITLQIESIILLTGLCGIWGGGGEVKREGGLITFFLGRGLI